MYLCPSLQVHKHSKMQLTSATKLYLTSSCNNKTEKLRNIHIHRKYNIPLEISV